MHLIEPEIFINLSEELLVEKCKYAANENDKILTFLKHLEMIEASSK